MNRYDATRLPLDPKITAAKTGSGYAIELALWGGNTDEADTAAHTLPISELSIVLR